MFADRVVDREVFVADRLGLGVERGEASAVWLMRIGQQLSGPAPHAIDRPEQVHRRRSGRRHVRREGAEELCAKLATGRRCGPSTTP